MLKLTRYLFSWQPSSTLGDYYERALYNHILSSQNPQTGMMCYFVPLRMGTKKEFSDPVNTFTCCVGSGMENHTKYTEGIYYEGKDGSLFVNLFIGSELNWKDKGVKVKQETAFPESNKTSITVQTTKPKTFTIKVRQPRWSKDVLQFAVNGSPFTGKLESNGYWSLNRKWSDNDKVEITLPAHIYSETMPDNQNRVALLYGPIVLAGQLGTTMPDPVYGSTVLLTDNHDVKTWVKSDNQPWAFETNKVAKPNDVKLIPFYKTYDQYYNVYWDYFTPAEWTTRQAEYEAEKKRIQEIEDRTIDIIRIGEMQPERDHNLKATEKSYVSDALGRMGREVRTGGYFEFDMKVDDTQSSNLLCSYLGDDKNSFFDLLIDGTKIGTQELKGGTVGRFFDVEYPIPAELIKGKTKAVVRVQAHPNKTAGRVFGCRIVKA